MLIDPDEAGRRVRAARGYAKMTREHLSALGPLTLHQLKLLEDGKRNVTTREELIELGALCGVPDEFMDGGFSGLAGMHEQLAKILGALMSGSMDLMVKVAADLGLQPSPEIEKSLKCEMLETETAPRRASGPATHNGAESDRQDQRLAH